MLPVQPAEPTRAVIERSCRVLGKSLGVARVPTWALRVMGLFNRSVRELVARSFAAAVVRGNRRHGRVGASGVNPVMKLFLMLSGACSREASRRRSARRRPIASRCPTRSACRTTAGATATSATQSEVRL